MPILQGHPIGIDHDARQLRRENSRLPLQRLSGFRRVAHQGVNL